MRFYQRVTLIKDANRTADSKDPDLIALLGLQFEKYDRINITPIFNAFGVTQNKLNSHLCLKQGRQFLFK